MEETFRITLHLTDGEVDHIGIGQWQGVEIEGLLSAPVGPFDADWSPVVDRCRELLDVQLRLF